MRRIRTFLFLGIWIAILPYLGFPSFWKNVLFTLSGLLLIFFSSVLYKEHKNIKNTKKKTFENFSENSFNASSDEKSN